MKALSAATAAGSSACASGRTVKSSSGKKDRSSRPGTTPTGSASAAEVRRFTKSESPARPARAVSSTDASPVCTKARRVTRALAPSCAMAGAAMHSSTAATRAASRPRSRSDSSRSAASSSSAAASSQGPRSRSGGMPAMARIAVPGGGAACGAGAGTLPPRFRARRKPSLPGAPYQPGGVRAVIAASPAAGTGCAPGGGAPRRPKPSSVSIGGSGPAPSSPATPPESATSRRSICTKRPESGSSDHSALAVTWNSTTRPWPRASPVTSGVPSASRAQMRGASCAEGSASTWRVTVTSFGTARPAKGEPSGKGARRCGCSQDSAPPSWRSARSRTGSSGSGFSARRGPAKRSSSPPASTKRVTAASSAPSSGRSARISTESGRASSADASPRRSSAKGDRARSR